MKRYIYLALVLFNSCSNPNKNFLVEEKESYIPIVIGKWTTCSYECEGSVVQFNICPTIAFHENGQGTIKTGNSNEEKFEWYLEKANLSIHSIQEPKYSTFFPDSLFSIQFRSEMNNGKLVITGKNKNCSYLFTETHSP